MSGPWTRSMPCQYWWHEPKLGASCIIVCVSSSMQDLGMQFRRCCSWTGSFMRMLAVVLCSRSVDDRQAVWRYVVTAELSNGNLLVQMWALRGD